MNLCSLAIKDPVDMSFLSTLNIALWTSMYSASISQLGTLLNWDVRCDMWASLGICLVTQLKLLPRWSVCTERQIFQTINTLQIFRCAKFLHPSNRSTTPPAVLQCCSSNEPWWQSGSAGNGSNIALKNIYNIYHMMSYLILCKPFIPSRHIHSIIKHLVYYTTLGIVKINIFEHFKKYLNSTNIFLKTDNNFTQW